MSVHLNKFNRMGLLPAVFLKILRILLLVTGLAIPQIGASAHLGMIPTIDKNNLRLIVEGRTDLWTSIYRDKETPLRLHELKIRAPLITSESWSASAHAGSESLSSGRADLTVGNDPVFIGSDLRSHSAGFGIKRIAADTSAISIFAAYCSAGDQPYRDTRDIWTEVTVFYEFAPKDTLQWVVAVNNSKNRGFYNDQVIPFLGVHYKPTSNFSATFGFPYARFTWSNEGSRATSLYLTPVGVHSEMTNTISHDIDWRIKAGLSSRSYLHINRLDDRMRLIYEEKYLEGGIRTKVSEQTFMHFSFGASFDRSFYEAKSVFSAEGPKTNVNQDLYGTIKMEFEL
jgi:hypothetical protein